MPHTKTPLLSTHYTYSHPAKVTQAQNIVEHSRHMLFYLLILAMFDTPSSREFQDLPAQSIPGTPGLYPASAVAT